PWRPSVAAFHLRQRIVPPPRGYSRTTVLPIPVPAPSGRSAREAAKRRRDEAVHGRAKRSGRRRRKREPIQTRFRTTSPAVPPHLPGSIVPFLCPTVVPQCGKIPAFR